MPTLKNPNREAFAQARARGARLLDAYEDAGFNPDRGHASRLAHQHGVSARIAELRAEHANLEAAGPHALIATLLRIAQAAEAEAPATPASHREVRLTPLEVDRLRRELAHDRDKDRAGDPKDSISHSVFY